MYSDGALSNNCFMDMALGRPASVAWTICFVSAVFGFLDWHRICWNGLKSSIGAGLISPTTIPHSTHLLSDHCTTLV